MTVLSHMYVQSDKIRLVSPLITYPKQTLRRFPTPPTVMELARPNEASFAAPSSSSSAVFSSTEQPVSEDSSAAAALQLLDAPLGAHQHLSTADALPGSSMGVVAPGVQQRSSSQSSAGRAQPFKSDCNRPMATRSASSSATADAPEPAAMMPPQRMHRRKPPASHRWPSS